MRIVRGVATIGAGTFNSVNAPIAHRKWSSMCLRVYSPTTDQMKVDYLGCEICDEWHSFQNFAEWFFDQPFAGMSRYELDKDLIKPGNKTYCPEFCSIIPKELNAAISADKRKNLHGVGVGYVPATDKYFSSIRYRGKVTHLGTFSTKEEASAAYRKVRPFNMDRLADELFNEGKITSEQAELVKKNYGTKK